MNCQRCRHFFITWDPKRPYGCRALGFKTPQIPSALVRAASGGMHCQFFRKRPSWRAAGKVPDRGFYA